VSLLSVNYCFLPLQLRHFMSATKICCWRISIFHKPPFLKISHDQSIQNIFLSNSLPVQWNCQSEALAVVYVQYTVTSLIKCHNADIHCSEVYQHIYKEETHGVRFILTQSLQHWLFYFYQHWSRARAGLNEREAPDKILIARPPKTLRTTA